MTDPPVWQPEPGAESTRMLERTGLDQAARTNLLEEATRILGRCTPPRWDERNATAELVVGEVQSGKTMSFTSVTALARDNGYPLVVILAGTKNNLRAQTFERLQRDLAMAGSGGLPAWSAIENPNERDATDVARRIRNWVDNPARNHVTTVVVVLKQTTRLQQAGRFLERVATACGNFPALVIDDEADQAGLNLAWRRDAESPTYRSIKALRAALPSHSYVLYTATPQAPLLLSLADTVSPRTVTVLRRGDGYVGGQDLFSKRRRGFVREIEDIDEALDPGHVAAPASLQAALATFLVALVVSQVRGTPRPLTMLVHPSAATELHRVYERWIEAVLARISAALDSGDAEYIRQLSDSLMLPAYEDLVSTGGTLVDGIQLPLDDVLRLLPDYLAETKVQVINSQDGREIGADDWPRQPGWIVVGGNKLDRGFTVQNLAVTYMPRGPGVRNADTVQQRGRFFGYKRGYVDLLRAWLNPDTAGVYADYVRHETAMRAELEQLDASGTPLREWRRQLLLAQHMNPTRAAVMSLDVTSARLNAGWTLAQDALYTDLVLASAQPQHLIQHARDISEPDPRDRRAGGARNRIASTSWAEAARLLLDWGASTADRERLDALLYTVAALDEKPGVEIVLMDGADTRQPRHRGPDRPTAAELQRVHGRLEHIENPETLHIDQLMQGADPAGADRYPGDRAFRSEDKVTIQIHAVAPRGAAALGAENGVAYALAIHLPTTLDRVIQGREV